MLLVKKCQFFLSLVLVKTRLEKRFNNVLDRKETFFKYQKKIFLKSQKAQFSKGVNPCFWSKNAKFSLFLDFVKIRLEKMLNNFVEKQEIKTKIFESPKNLIFPKGLTHAFG